MTDRPSLSGRATNVMMNHIAPVARYVSRRQSRLFETSAGTKGAKLMGRPVFRLVVKGRTSGEPRSVMLMLVLRDDDLLVCGSQGGTAQAPNWWKNLLAAGTGTAQVGGETYPVGARVVTDEAERAETWALRTAAYPDFASYQLLTERVLPIAVLSRSAG